MKAVLKENAAAVPKEVVRRGLDDGTERLRTQLRDAAQDGRSDEYGGDRIEDAAASGLRRTEHGAERLLKKKPTGRSEQPSPAQPTPEDSAEHTPVKTKEAAQQAPSAGLKGDSGTARAGPGRPGPTAGASAQAGPPGAATPRDGQGRPSIKTKDSYIRGQAATPAAQAPLSQAQGGREFVRERGRKAVQSTAIGRRGMTGNQPEQSVSPSRGAEVRPHSVREPGVVSSQNRYTPRGGMSRNAETPHAQAGSLRPGVKGRPPARAPQPPGRQTVKAAEHNATQAAGRAAQGAKQMLEAGRQAVRTQKAAKAAQATAKRAAQAAGRALRAIGAAARGLMTAILAGGWVVIVIVLLICLIGMLVASPFGVFFSGEDSGSGYTMPEAVVQLNGEFTNKIEQIKADNPYDTLNLDNAGSAAMVSNWDDVLAVYAVRTSTNDAAPEEVATLTEEKLAILREIFWDMNAISYWVEVIPGDEDESSTTVLHITVTIKDHLQMADVYGFTAEQRELLAELMESEYQELFLRLTGSYQDIALSPAEVREIIEKLPADLSEERKQVVLTAYQLLGKVNYFWGGKSLVLGWDARWGTPMEVTSAGSSTTGSMRPFGMDCSGYVDWVFYNMTGGEYVIGHGGGASAQHSYCTDISWSEAVPGDLVFYPGDSHVGIVCGFDADGNVQIIHCASGQNNVVVTGQSGFTSIARPAFYSE